MFSKPKPKQPSGYQNRKRKAIASKDAKASTKLLCSFLNKPNSSSNSTKQNGGAEQSGLPSEKEHQLGAEHIDLPFEVQEQQISDEHIDLPSEKEKQQEQEPCPDSDSDTDMPESSPGIADVAVDYVDHYFKDLATWPEHLNASLRDLIITKGPIAPELESYPRDGTKRLFSNSFYYRVAKNGQKVKRHWLVYSQNKNSVYCFCCKIFNTTGSSTSLSDKNGNSDWRHIGNTLSNHETSSNHMKFYEKWIEAAVYRNDD